jgi:mRNA interferase MazF
MIKQGQIVVAPFPYSDFSATKERPALIISNTTVNESQDVIIVGISKSIHTQHGVKIHREDYTEKSLQEESYVHTHKIHIIKKNKTKKNNF